MQVDHSNARVTHGHDHRSEFHGLATSTCSSCNGYLHPMNPLSSSLHKDQQSVCKCRWCSWTTVRFGFPLESVRSPFKELHADTPAVTRLDGLEGRMVGGSMGNVLELERMTMHITNALSGQHHILRDAVPPCFKRRFYAHPSPDETIQRPAHIIKRGVPLSIYPKRQLQMGIFHI